MKSVLLFLIYIATTAVAAQNVPEKSSDYFVQMTKVLRHPRCLNCHPAGDQPTQGMDKHVHQMNVVRGLDNHGAIAMRCTTCHTDKNYDAAGVPGAPKWSLAPKDMGWQTLNDRDLCNRIKKTMKDHNISNEKFIDHNTNDPLVGWGWNPGKGRVPVPGTQKEFGAIVAKWINSGAVCP